MERPLPIISLQEEIMKKNFLSKILGINLGNRWETQLKNWGWLILRVLVALLMLRHGFGKLMDFNNMAPHFPDPLGIGSSLSLSLVVVSEFFASVFLVFGFLTRWSSLTTFITMMVAAFIIHGTDPFDKKEMAITYAIIYLFFICVGGGKYSLDNYLKRKFKL